jgi:DNA-binding PadR family transcriptional regulator
MSSTTRLLVLGVVKLFQPVHGYEVRRELISWRAQEWASVQPGSIYNALKTLTRDGLLEVASTEKGGGRPERTTYRLTKFGEEEFHTLLREEWWTVRPPIDPLMAAASFLGEISRAEAIAALEHRTAQIHGMLRHVEFAIEAHDGRESPFHVREMMRLMNARVASELDWAQQFLERLRRGEYTTLGDPPWEPPPGPDVAPPGDRRTIPPPTAPGARRTIPPATAPGIRRTIPPANGAPGAASRSRRGAARRPDEPRADPERMPPGAGESGVEPSAAAYVRARRSRRSARAGAPPRRR